MKRYAIWNKTDPIITPSGAVFTAAQWVERHPAAGVPSITVVCAAGEINGGIYDTLGQMVSKFEQEGCVFAEGLTPEEKLAVIEAFEDAREEENRASAMKQAQTEEMNAMSLASIAAQMEFQNMMALPDEEV